MTILRLTSFTAITSLLVLSAACDGGVQNQTGGSGPGGTGGTGAQGASGAEGGAGNGGPGPGGGAAGGQGGQALCDAGWDKLEECFGEVGELPQCDAQWTCLSECILPATCEQLEDPNGPIAACAEACSDVCALASEHLTECGVSTPGLDCDSCEGQCQADCAASASCADLQSAGGAYGACLEGCVVSETPCSMMNDKFTACGLGGGDEECSEFECSPEMECFANCIANDTCAQLESGDNFQPCADACGLGEGGSSSSAGGSQSTGVGGAGG
jgi:hypothetical protein